MYEFKQNQKEAMARLQERIEFARAELAKRGFNWPGSPEDLEHMARVFEMPREMLKSGEFTFSDVYDYMLAWEDREGIKRKSTSSQGAILCTQADVYRFSGGKGRGRGRILERLKGQGFIESWQKQGTKYLVVFSNPADGERFQGWLADN
jgi:hypothetical protein